ncbi:MAG: hypothetical protein NTV22_01875 [bacterium]|nr:hypothetical protein [bacterium]
MSCADEERQPVLLVQRPGVALAIVLATALVVRLCALWTRGVIVVDGARYLEWAQCISRGDWSAAFNLRDFNLFPIVISALHTAITAVAPVSLETAALTLNIVLGTLLVVPVFRIALRYFGIVPAYFAGAYVALNPLLCELSTEVLRETPYVFFEMLGLMWFLGAVVQSDARRWCVASLIGAGVSLLIAGLFRVEGFGVLACCALTLLLAYAHSARPYAAMARLARAGVLVAGVLALGAAGILGAHALTGRWHFARLDNLNKGYSLGTRVTRAADPLQVNKAEMFDVRGFVRSRNDHRQSQRRAALFAAEIADGIWRATHGIGLFGCVAGIWYLARRRALRLDDPLVIMGVLLLGGFGVVFARYTANTFYFSERHALSVVVPLAVVFGAPLMWQAQWGARQRVLVHCAYYLGFFILAVAAVLPRDWERIPLKTCGLALRHTQTNLTALIAPPDLFLVSYYAQTSNVVLPFAASNSVALQQMKATDVLLINVNDPWQASLLPLLTNTYQPVPLAVPDTKKYALRAMRRQE